MVESDGPRAGIPAVASGAFVLSGLSGILYHFTIAEDQARLINSQLEVHLFDIEAGVPHNYRLELSGTDEYRVYIDGMLVHSGFPTGPYPTVDSVIAFGAAAATRTCTTRWDFIRFGVLPTAAPGDVNCDGAINFVDIDPFVLALFDADAYGQQFPGCDLDFADLNVDGHVDFLDIDPFVACLFEPCP